MLLLWNLSILDLTRLCRRGWSLYQGHCDMFFGKTLCSSLVTGINRYWQSIKVTSWVERGIRWTPLPGGVVNSPNYFMWQISQFIMWLISLCHLLTLRREGNYCTSSLRIKQHYSWAIWVLCLLSFLPAIFFSSGCSKYEVDSMNYWLTVSHLISY